MVALAQHATHEAPLGGADSVVMGSAPTEGNLLVLKVRVRSPGGQSLPAPDGWTAHPAGTTFTTAGNTSLSTFYRLAGASETTTVASFGTIGTGSGWHADVAEWSGAGALVAWASAATDLSAAFSCGSVTPPAGTEALIIGAAALTKGDGFGVTVTPDAGVTELYDASLSGARTPNGWTGYRIVDVTAGAYSISGTAMSSGSPINLDTAAQTLVFADAAPEPPPPAVDFEVCEPDGTNCVLFERLVKQEIRVELNGPGSGHFVLSRYDEQATEANLKRGNIVRAKFTEIDADPIFEFILETGDFQLISSDEEGGELLSFGGRGTLALLENAIIDPEPTQEPVVVAFREAGVWKWINQEAGNIIRRMMDEAENRGVLAHVTRNFTNTHDSAGVLWTPMGGWLAPILSNLYTEVMRLVAAGQLHVEMEPGFVFNAYQTIGTDRTGSSFGAGVVRFVKGVNIADELSRAMVGQRTPSHVVARGSDGSYARAEVADPPFIVELGIEVQSDDETVMETAAENALVVRAAAANALLFAMLNPSDGVVDEDAGLYLPGQEWTANGKFWVGDLVTLHTGSGEFDFTNDTHRVYAITLMADETGRLAPPIIELNAPFPTEGDSSEPNLTPAMGGSDSGSSGGSSSGHVHTAYTTLAQADTLIGDAILDHETDEADAHLAVGVSYDNTVSALAAADVQTAIDEIAAASGVTLSDDTPLVESGSGDAGTSGEASRSDHVHPADGGGGGGGTPALEPAPQPDADDDEFSVTDTTDPITDWTTEGTLDALNRNSTAPGHLYMRKAAVNATRIDGVRKSVTLADGEAFVAKMTDATHIANFNRAGIYIGVATPGRIDTCAVVWNNGPQIEVLAMTNPTTLSGTVVAAVISQHAPIYFAIRRNSSTSYDYLFSWTGTLWHSVSLARDPSMTQATVGLFVNPQSASRGMGAAFDWARIYTTLPGVVI